MKKLFTVITLSLLVTTSNAWMQPLSPKDPSDYSLLASVVSASALVTVISSPWLIVKDITRQSAKSTVTMVTQKNEQVLLDMHNQTIEQNKLKVGDELKVSKDNNGGAMITKNDQQVVYLNSKNHLSNNQEISK